MRKSFSPLIAGIFLFSLIYWLYLSLTTRMVVIFDSVSYQDLGRMIATKGWISYFTTGPNREPLYPLLVAASMTIEHITGLAFVRIMAFFGVAILFLSQVLTYKILRLLNIRQGICAGVLAYLALSPALNNAAFSLYSEIAALPIILGIILTSTHAWDALREDNRRRAFIDGALLGLLLTAATFVKAVFECIAPLYMIIFFAASWRAKRPPAGKAILTFVLCIISAVSFFYGPVTGYKWMNQHYNGHFAITNRASWALYGSTARRMEPLTLKKFAEALAFAPGEGVCDSIFSKEECDFWSYRKSDELGYAKAGESNGALLDDSVHTALRNPFQYALLTGVEGLKMFFWESTQVGFVEYPHWLQKIYNIKIFNNGLRLLVSLISLIAVVSLWVQIFKPQQSPLALLMGALIFFYIIFFSFFFILTRYALPIAPLYLISIGLWINQKK